MFLKYIERNQFHGNCHVFGMSHTSYRQEDGSYKDFKEYFFLFPELLFWKAEQK